MTALVDTGKPETYVGPSFARTVHRCSKKHSAEKLLTGKQWKLSKSNKTLETTGSADYKTNFRSILGSPM